MSAASEGPPPIGRVVATELKPSTPHQFHFWTARESPIGIGAIVRVEEGGSHGLRRGDRRLRLLRSGHAMHAVIGADGDPVAAGARADGARRDPAVHRRGAAPGARGAAAARAARRGLARERRRRARSRCAWTPTPAASGPPGFRSGSTPPAGPSRRSISTATSCSAPRRRTSTSPASPGSRPRPARSSSCSPASSRPFPRTRAAVAALCFNVKGPDLCFLDQPGELERGGPPAVRPARAPARAVRRRALLRPYKADGVNLNTLRTHEALAANTEPLVWGLREVLDYAEVRAQPRRRGRQGRRVHRLPRRARGRAGVSGRHAARQAVPGAELRGPRGVLPRDLRFHGGARARAARCGGRTTSRPSGRCGTG